MQGMGSGVRGRHRWHRRSRRCRSSPRSASLVRGFAFGQRPRGLRGSGAFVRAVGYALGCNVAVVWLGYALEGGRCGRRLARCVLRGGAAMDADNGIGREGAASLAPALEKMPQLTSLGLSGARIRFWAKASGGWGGPGHWCVLLGTRLDAMWLWCGWGTRLRAGDAADGLRGVCVRSGAAMDAGNELGREGAASLVPALEKMPQLASLGLSGARFRFGQRPRGAGGVRVIGGCCWVHVSSWMRCAVVGVRA
jgi:hypothetical protein